MTILKYRLILIVFVLFLFGNGFQVSAASTAPKLNASCTWSINGETASPYLSDESIITSFLFTQGMVLHVQCDSPIAYVYILFDKAPSLYTVTTPHGTQNAGIFGFLHELIPLNEPSNEVTLNLNPGRVASIFVYGEGPLPSDVQVWKTPASDADLLVLAAHSDDEALYFGPAIVKSIAAGKTVQVAYLTNHFATRRRPHETLDSLWVLGVRNYPIFGPWPDRQATTIEQGYALFPKDEVTAYEVGLIRRFKPEVILSHDFAGEYGHGAHMVLSDVLKQAILLSADEKADAPSAVVYGTFTPSKVYIHLYAVNPILLDVYTPIPSYDNKSPLQVARDAYEKHVTQHIWPLRVIDYSVGDVRKFGLYYTSVGLDTSNDLFQHILPKHDIKPRPDYDPHPDPSDHHDQSADLIPTVVGSCIILAVLIALFTLLIQRKRT